MVDCPGGADPGLSVFVAGEMKIPLSKGNAGGALLG